MISPRKGGANSNSPGPVYVEVAISPPAMSFFIENLTAPLSVMVGDMAIIIPNRFRQWINFLLIMRDVPGFADNGHPIASWSVIIELLSL